ALCIGLNPFYEICANYTSPHLITGQKYSEFDIAGAWMGRPLELVKCETVDLQVPADTEIVIEGYIPPGGRIHEGPMGEYTDYYAYQGPTPYIQVTAITMRKNPIYHTLICGHTQEDLYLGALSSLGNEQKANKRVKAAFPNVKAVANHAGSFGFHLVVSMKQRFAGEDRLLLHYMFATSLNKYITIVDEDIDPYNPEQVEWARAMRAGRNPDDFVVVRTHTFEMDPDSDEKHEVSRLGVLATLPFGEKFVKPGPPMAMQEAMRPLFNKEVLGGK
ncbi:MAG: UbiD family decarboxylase, partial [Dehalococcoidia bacterium]|nr:UbiD family decarboxylase [Dehalococcoidia bacterium]